jgi:hypothetical protein
VTGRLTEQGVRDTLTGLADVSKAITNAERRAELVAAQAEAELLALRKIRGFVDLAIEQHRAELRALEDAKAQTVSPTIQTENRENSSGIADHHGG